MSNTIYHKHHIVPKHMGGSDDPSNLVLLTIEEHAEAHKELYEKYGRVEDKLAWMGLSGMIGKDEILAELWKENGRKVGSLSSKGRKYPKSEETRRKISKTLTGHKQSEETKQKRADDHRGRKNTPETIEKMKLSAKNRPPVSEESRRRMSEAAKRRYKK